jgi:hypothetical protein
LALGGEKSKIRVHQTNVEALNDGINELKRNATLMGARLVRQGEASNLLAEELRRNREEIVELKRILLQSKSFLAHQ